MRKFINLFMIATVVFFLNSCSKELNSGNGVSTGVLNVGSGNTCLPITINGIYRVDSVLTADNYVDVQVNSDNGGSFNIISNTVNGFSFAKSGRVGLGNNTIRLYGTGKPLAAGANTFTINYGSNSCTFTINVFGVVAGQAIYTLNGSPNTCTNFSTNGTLMQNIPSTATNSSVTFGVNVSTLGAYSITTNTSNNVTYAASGNFTTTGTQSVTLFASGTPSSASSNTYTPTVGLSTCSFTTTTNALSAGTASYSLVGSPNNCSGAYTNGTYTNGVALTTLNNMVVQVNVSNIGTYTIATNTTNGMSFYKIGSFTTTGLQPLVLNAIGTPAAAGTYSYTLTSGSPYCSVAVVVN